MTEINEETEDADHNEPIGLNLWEIGNVIYSHPMPLMFAVPTLIEPNLIGNWLTDLIKEFREYSTNVRGMSIFSGDPNKRITPRGRPSSQTRVNAKQSNVQPRFITISREVKYAISSWISWMYTEIFMGIIYCHHRAYEIEDLVTMSNMLSRMISGPTADIEKARPMIKRWVKAYGLYRSRSGIHVPAGTKDRDLMELRTLMATNSHQRLKNRFEAVRTNLLTELGENGRNRALKIDDVMDVIHAKCHDYHHPLDGMFFEMMYVRHKAGMGFPRLERMINETKRQGASSSVLKKHGEILERFTRDFAETIIPSLRAADPKLENEIVISSKFIEEVARVLSDFILDLVICFFNFAIAYTDGASGTTIQLRAIKIILSQMASADLVPCSGKMYNHIELLIKHALQKGSGR